MTVTILNEKLQMRNDWGVSINETRGKPCGSQMIELHPVFTLEQAKRFGYGNRNVIVIRKMTFPNDKKLTIEMTENQICGRTISLKVNYSDVLSADSFNPIFLKKELC